MSGKPSPRKKLLVVDDGERHIELCHTLLRGYDYATRCREPGPCWTCGLRAGCTSTHAHDLVEAEEALRAHDVDAVLLDLSFELPDARLAPSSERDPERRRALQGLDILRALRHDRPSLPVVLMTEQSALDWADAADALAADEYVTLAGRASFDAQALALLVERAVPDRTPATRYVWGDDARMARLRRDVTALARTSLPLLVLGETGTGKTRLAEDILHPASRRRGPFLAVDLASLPPDLVAAELFGTARGAFSGAVDRAGALESADGGTLFLDEIGNLPLEAQRVLLTAIERNAVTRLGETRTRPIDVKLVAATNADLSDAVRAGRFRADLYARLNPALRIELLPLRERAVDLPALVEHFVQRAFDRPADRALLDQLETDAVPGVELPGHTTTGATIRFAFDRATLGELRRHPWTGNLRELRSVVATAVLLTITDAVQLPRASTWPVSRKLVRTLLAGGKARAAPSVPPQKKLHEVARHLERAHYERLFISHGGRFEDMAEALLGKRDAIAARQVRLRFNQLGLKARRKS